MPDRIFLLHGMGVHEADWAANEKKFLEDFCAKYAELDGGTVDQYFKIVPLEYDSVFRTYLQTLKTRTAEIAAVNTAMGGNVPGGWVDKLVEWGQQAPATDNNFLWSHAFDVILYRFAPTLRFEIHAHLAQQIQSEIKTRQSGETWSIVAHSLGTIVCHDLVHRWNTAQVGPIAKLGDQERPLAVMMLANVSLILQNDIKVLSGESTVQPGQACTHYINVLHRLDPITVVKPFDPSNWPSDPGERSRYAQVEVNHVQQVNIHEFLHYLRHPDVVTRLLRTLRFRGFVTDAKRAEYVTEFNKASQLNDTQAGQVINWLQDVRDGKATNLPPFLSAYKPIVDLIAGLQ